MASSAESIPGPITEQCAAIAREHGIFLIPGSLYEKEGIAIYNTAPVFNPQGELIERYRKMYPWRPHEKTTPGNRTAVFEIAGVGKVGVCVCYDLWFPEVIRDLAWKGAEVIMIPTLTGTQDREQELILTRAAAIANQCFVASINGLGKNGKGQSMLVDPEGNVLQMAGQVPENMLALLDLDRVDQVRQYGTCGVSRPLTSFLHEAHRFPHQEMNAKSPPLKGCRFPMEDTENDE
jgi:formamidase